ncbi:hypothetical protein PHET_09154 [Paragonimus heterotremus]|uniref:Uncharacterized protein n=1 Tax=Paragonimus heterotremus TaxID=100268 RepID=A0A8J4TAL3_9TREM|nr:hypothetical protein PHET_09154 [Paragonimus heterotremus]
MASKSNRNIPTISVPESKSASILGSSGLVKRVVPQAKSCGSSPHSVGMTSTLSQDTVNLNWVREEAEWEKCSVNPGVARQVKTRNIIERRRLTALQTQLDRKLEKELKRLTIERREFSDVLDNLLIRRRKSHQLNVRRHRRRDSHEAEERQLSSGELMDQSDSVCSGGNSPLSRLINNLRQTTKNASDSNTPNLPFAPENLETSRNDLTGTSSLN